MGQERAWERKSQGEHSIQRARQKFRVKQRAGWVTRPEQWEKANLFPGAQLGIHCWRMIRRFVFGLRVSSKGRTHSVVWVSLIDEKSFLLIKSHSSVVNVSVSKIKCRQNSPKTAWDDLITILCYLTWECAKTIYFKYPNSLSELRISIFCFPFLFF